MSDTAGSLTSSADLLDLSGRAAIVTGGGQGIGLGIVRRLHDAGASVLVVDLDGAAAQAAAEPLAALRAGSCLGVACDVADEASVAAALAAAVEHFGDVDILVNNAGIYPMVELDSLELDLLRRVLEVNLVGVYLFVRAVAAQMVSQGRGGRIVNVTSIDALHPSMIGLAAYDASKHGVWGFTKNAALDLARHNIWVNAVAPGGIDTPGAHVTDDAARVAFEAMIPMGRLGMPDDIARTVHFLASDLASYITGTQIVVDGGRLLQ